MRWWLGQTLAVVVAWCTGYVLLGAVVAVTLFRSAPPEGSLLTSRADAGALFGTILVAWTTAGWVFLALVVTGLLVLAVLLSRRRQHGLVALCLASAAACAALQWSETILVGRTHALSIERRAHATVDPELERRFTLMHGRSSQIGKVHAMLLAVFAAGLLVAVARNDSASATNGRT